MVNHQCGAVGGRVLVAATALAMVSVALSGCSSSPSTEAKSLCQGAFGSKALNWAPGTVQDVRTLRIGPGVLAAPHAFPKAAANEIVGLCWTGKPGNYELYAVAGGYKPVRVEGLGGKYETTTPGPGTVPFP